MFFATAVACAHAVASEAQPLPDDLTASVNWREIGPSVFGGRITDIELHPGDPNTLFVAAASGGLFVSPNNGTTWNCIFQNEGSISIGDIAIDPGNPDVIYIGTGEANNQRSSYWGDGVYKTTDGGKSWTHLGLEASHHIGRIVIDPNDSNTIYVAALGHLYTHNDERGLYTSTDGGATWEKSLSISPEVGVVDVVVNPKDSNILYAASYERLRRPWHFDGAGPGSAIYRSTDRGATWARLEGGLPSGDIGRIGLSIFPDDPNILYATVSNQNGQPGELKPDLGFEGELTAEGWRIKSVNEGSSAAEQGLAAGDILTELGGIAIKSVWDILKALSSKTAQDSVEVVVRRGDEEIRATIDLGVSDEERDEHGMPARMIGGEIYRTADGGDTWTRQNERPVGGSPPYYYGQIRVDPSDSNRIYVLSVPVYMSEDAGKTWNRGNLASSVHVDHHALVIDPTNPRRLVLGNDGGLAISYDRGATWDHYNNMPFAQFYAVGIDYQVPYHVYGGTQDNGTWGGPHTAKSRGTVNHDWYNVGGGDGFYAQVDPRNPDIVYAESQFGSIYRLDKSNWSSAFIRPRQNETHEPYRFNWNSPILISPHNPEIIYFGGNRLFKSFNRGDDWAIVSEDLTTADEAKVKGNVPHCTITTIAESPIDPRIVVVGTDDGLLQWSEDGGLSFLNMTDRLAGLPEAWWCSRVELSRHDVNVAYASFTGYREDDFRPLLYKTADRGATWTSIVANLPHEPVNVVREDPRNPNLLYVGTEFGVWVSTDRGGSWAELEGDLPTIPIHDLAVHPRDRDLIVATHGRGFWVTDVAALQDWTADVANADAHLFSVEDAYQWSFGSSFGWSGDRAFQGEAEPSGATIAYRFRNDQTPENVTLTILDVAGETVQSFDLDENSLKAGLHRLNWNLRRQPQESEGEGGGAQRAGRRGRGGAQPVSPGRYTAVLKVGEKVMQQRFEVKSDPGR